MADRVIIPLADGRWLALDCGVFAAALAAGAVFMGAPTSIKAEPAAIHPSSLLNAKAVADALSLPESWIREKERQGEIPSQRAGRYVRFDLAAVQKALSKTVNGTVGHR